PAAGWTGSCGYVTWRARSAWTACRSAITARPASPSSVADGRTPRLAPDRRSAFDGAEGDAPGEHHADPGVRPMAAGAQLPPELGPAVESRTPDQHRQSPTADRGDRLGEPGPRRQ